MKNAEEEVKIGDSQEKEKKWEGGKERGNRKRKNRGKKGEIVREKARREGPRETGDLPNFVCPEATAVPSGPLVCSRRN